MAIIYLEPNEGFQHVHHVESQTTLVKGEVEFIIEEDSIKLKIGKPINVPANALHTMKNIGQKVAVLSCAHQPVEPL
jgi:quercetin dioxygenase-like cupin family protein